ncbi:MAG TPA: polyprenyl synthetase family protein [bacterium]|nr:polyprenyl synthetase family protein [bacterium]
MDFDSKLAWCQALVNEALNRGSPPRGMTKPATVETGEVPPKPHTAAYTAEAFQRAAPTDRLKLAIQYALIGGKRLRPCIVFCVAEMLGRKAREFLDTACAVECIHTSSLILDDLPCMDDSSTRRKKLSLHRKFDEPTAILAAVSLLSHGFAYLSANVASLGSAAGVADRVFTLLAETVGPTGMAAGQVTELSADRAWDLNTLEYVNEHKTGQLFAASAQLPAILAGASEQDVNALSGYAHNLGLAYQISDDILDGPARVYSDLGGAELESAGMPSSFLSDPSHLSPRQTIATLLGADEAARIASKHITKGVSFLDRYKASAEPLRQLAGYVISRIG